MKQGKAGLSFMAMRVIVRSSEQLLTSHFEPPKLLVIGPTVHSSGAVCATACSGMQTVIATSSRDRRIKYSSFCGTYSSRILQSTSIEECFTASRPDHSCQACARPPSQAAQDRLGRRGRSLEGSYLLADFPVFQVFPAEPGGSSGKDLQAIDIGPV